MKRKLFNPTTLEGNNSREEGNRIKQLKNQRKRTWQEQLAFDIAFDNRRQDWRNKDQYWVREREKYYK